MKSFFRRMIDPAHPVLAFALSFCGVLLAATLRSRSTTETFAVLLASISFDVLLFSLAVSLVGLGNLKLQFAAALIIGFAGFTSFTFQSRMGVPLTFDLITQVGDLASMQTSISHGSTWYSIRFLLLINTVFIFLGVVGFLMLNKLSPRRFLLIMTSTMTSLGLLFLTSATTASLWTSKSVFLPLIKSTLGGFSTYRPPAELESEPALEPPKITWIEGQPKRDVLMIVVESLGKEDFNADNFPTFFDEMTNGTHSILSWQNHYAPWSFSSKSLYSLVCGAYPFPDSRILMRSQSRVPCKSPLKDLSEKHGYRVQSLYSGDFNYDNMGDFLQTQLESSNIDRHGDTKAEANSWGIDDRAMVHKFDTSPGRFLALVLTINSHHPGWVPESSPADSIWHHQDQVIADYITTLRVSDQWQNTILMVTGDHGRRVDQSGAFAGALNKKMFHVPFLVLHPDPSMARQDIDIPTGHVDVPGIINNLVRDQMPILSANHGTLIFSTLNGNEAAWIDKEGVFYFGEGGNQITFRPNWEEPAVDCNGDCRQRQHIAWFYKRVTGYD